MQARYVLTHYFLKKKDRVKSGFFRDYWRYEYERAKEEFEYDTLEDLMEAFAAGGWYSGHFEVDEQFLHSNRYFRGGELLYSTYDHATYDHWTIEDRKINRLINPEELANYAWNNRKRRYWLGNYRNSRWLADPRNFRVRVKYRRNRDREPLQAHGSCYI